MKRKLIYLFNLMLLLAAGSVLAQSGGGYDLEWQVVGATGGEFVTGGGYQLGFTLAQDTPPGVSEGGGYQIVQGYWLGGGAPPTAVTLAAFWVEPRGQALYIRWETTTETGNLGFHVYRSQSPEGERQRLNEVLIASLSPGGSEGAVYEFLDDAVERGVTYQYWLELVDVGGGTCEHGPVSAALPFGNQYQIYVPLVGR